MRIAVASGKGGAGKTSIAASLVLAKRGTLAMDLDVEEPNLAIMLGVEPEEVRPVRQPVAFLEPDFCSACGRCARECAYGAIAWFGSGLPVVNESLCHGCGVCSHVCPTGAMRERERTVGEIRFGSVGGAPFLEGRLQVGSVSTVRVIEETIRAGESLNISDWILDASPGASCPVAAALRACDAALLVAEPTPFGLSDLEGVLEVVADMEIPAGIVANKTGMGEESLEPLCRRFSVEVLARYPFSRSAAESGARGVCPYRSQSDWVWRTESLWRAIERRFS